LAHLSDDDAQGSLPSEAKDFQPSAGAESDGSSYEATDDPSAFVGSRLRLARSVWAEDIKVLGEQQAKVGPDQH